MIWTHRVGEDALPRMKCVRAFRGERFFRRAARAGLGLRTLGRQKRKIVDRSRPSELRVIECRKVARGRGKLRERQDQKNDMPQSSGNQRAARNSAFHPAVLEESANAEIVRHIRFAQEGCQTAADALMKTSPADFERWPVARFEADRRSRLFGLAKKVECVAGLVQRHVPLDYSVPRVFRLARERMRGHLKIDEALPAGVYSAESLSSAAAPTRRYKLKAASPCFRTRTRCKASAFSGKSNLRRCSAITMPPGARRSAAPRNPSTRP